MYILKTRLFFKTFQFLFSFLITRLRIIALRTKALKIIALNLFILQTSDLGCREFPPGELGLGLGGILQGGILLESSDFIADYFVNYIRQQILSNITIILKMRILEYFNINNDLILINGIILISKPFI